MEEHRYKHRYSLMCAETMSEKRHMKLTPDSGRGQQVGGGRETNASLGYCFILLETFTMTMYYFFN